MNTNQLWGVVEDQRLRVAAFLEPLTDDAWAHPSLCDGWTVKEELDHVVDVVIDSGECGTEPTTVVDLSSGSAEVVRVGAGDPARFE